jgi:hypothetical protein
MERTPYTVQTLEAESPTYYTRMGYEPVSLDTPMVWVEARGPHGEELRFKCASTMAPRPGARIYVGVWTEAEPRG